MSENEPKDRRAEVVVEGLLDARREDPVWVAFAEHKTNGHTLIIASLVEEVPLAARHQVKESAGPGWQPFCQTIPYVPRDIAHRAEEAGELIGARKMLAALREAIATEERVCGGPNELTRHATELLDIMGAGIEPGTVAPAKPALSVVKGGREDG